jgi:hypothetical protein
MGLPDLQIIAAFTFLHWFIFIKTNVQEARLFIMETYGVTIYIFIIIIIIIIFINCNWVVTRWQWLFYT